VSDDARPRRLRSVATRRRSTERPGKGSGEATDTAPAGAPHPACVCSRSGPSPSRVGGQRATMQYCRRGDNDQRQRSGTETLGPPGEPRAVDALEPAAPAPHGAGETRTGQPRPGQFTASTSEADTQDAAWSPHDSTSAPERRRCSLDKLPVTLVVSPGPWPRRRTPTAWVHPPPVA